MIQNKLRKRQINKDFQDIIHLGVKINIVLDNLKDAVKEMNNKIDETIVNEMNKHRKGD